MKIAKKTLKLGEDAYQIAIDRVIVAEIFEDHFDALEKNDEFLSFLQELLNEKGDAQLTTSYLAKTKKLKAFTRISEERLSAIKPAVDHALPMMLEKAGMAKAESEQTATLIVEKVASATNPDDFYEAVWKFVALGFTTSAEEISIEVI